MSRTGTCSLGPDVERLGHYFFAHLERADVAAYLALGAGLGELIPLHRVGCDAAQLTEYREVGVSLVRDVLRFRSAGWGPAYLAAVGVEPGLVLGYLRCGITLPTLMRRLAALNAPPALVHQLTAASGFRQSLDTVEPLPFTNITVDGWFGPLEFVVEDGLLEAATIDVRQALEDESTIAVLAGGREPSRAMRLAREWNRGLEADWVALARVLGLDGDGVTLRLRWLKSVVAVPTSRFDGTSPALPLLSPPPPCPACIERDAFVHAREEAHRHAVPRGTA